MFSVRVCLGLVTRAGYRILFASGIGIEIRRVEMQASYRFGEPMMYDYWADPELAIGGRLIVSADIRVLGPAVLHIDGGYRISTVVHPQINGATWYWSDGRTTEEASINMSGMFWNGGIAVQF